jgi:hypothetical protein
MTWWAARRAREDAVAAEVAPVAGGAASSERGSDSGSDLFSDDDDCDDDFMAAFRAQVRSLRQHPCLPCTLHHEIYPPRPRPAFRAQRISELKQAAAAPRHGSLLHLSEDSYRLEVSHAQHSHFHTPLYISVVTLRIQNEQRARH